MPLTIPFVLTLFALTNICASATKQWLPDEDFTEYVIRRFDEMERRDGELQAEMEELRRENAELRHLREANVKLIKDVNRMTEKCMQLTGKIEQLEYHIQTLTTECWSLRCSNSSVSEKVAEHFEDDLKIKEVDTKGPGNKSVPLNHSSIPVSIKESSDRHGHNRIRQSEQGSTVAFFATRSVHAEHLGQHQPVVFDNVVTNVGQAYHNTTGFFVAPVSGIYVFSTTILGYKETAQFQIVVNGKVYSKMVFYDTETYETVSQTVIFNLSKGDDVSIQSYNLDKMVHGGHYSIFSGFLLAPIEGLMVVG